MPDLEPKVSLPHITCAGHNLVLLFYPRSGSSPSFALSCSDHSIPNDIFPRMRSNGTHDEILLWRRFFKSQLNRKKSWRSLGFVNRAYLRDGCSFQKVEYGASSFCRYRESIADASRSTSYSRNLPSDSPFPPFPTTCSIPRSLSYPNFKVAYRPHHDSDPLHRPRDGRQKNVGNTFPRELPPGSVCPRIAVPR